MSAKYYRTEHTYILLLLVVIFLRCSSTTSTYMGSIRDARHVEYIGVDAPHRHDSKRDGVASHAQRSRLACSHA